MILIAAIIGLSAASTLYDMPELFSSWPFRLLTAFFFLNLLLCSVQLWPGLLRRLRTKPAAIVVQSLQSSQLSGNALMETLKNQRFSVKETINAHGRVLLGHKNRSALLAPHILHIGLLVIILGAFLSTFGSTGQLSLGPGQSHALPPAISKHTGPGIITVDDFVTEYDAQGTRSNWITTFDLTFEGEAPIESQTTRVNKPFKHKGLSIYQMAYSDHHIIELTGEPTLAGTYALPENQRFPVGQETFRILPMTQDVALLMVYDENDNEVVQEAIHAGSSYQFADQTELTYIEPYSYTVLQLKYNTATPLVFLGFIIASLASLMLLLGRYQEVRALITPEGLTQVAVFCKNSEQREQLKKDFGLLQAEKEQINQ